MTHQSTNERKSFIHMAEKKEEKHGQENIK